MHTNTSKDTYKYSIILPAFNEESCLEQLIDRINKTLNPIDQKFEIICIDDGSTDNTWSIIEAIHKKAPHVKGIKLLRNFGHQLAVFAGIKQCSGQYVAILDADGQDPPEILPSLFEKCAEGYDVVYAVRKKRKENLLKRICYRVFYRFYKLIVPFNVPLDSGDFTVFSRPVADFLQSLPEKKPFIRGLRSWYGGKQIGVEYERHARVSGESKYSYYQLILLAINASISFSKTPLRSIGLLGILVSFISLLLGTYLLIYKITIGIPLLGWTSTTLLIVFFGGINLFVLGVIGEYIGEIFNEVKDRPQYLVDKILD